MSALGKTESEGWWEVDLQGTSDWYNKVSPQVATINRLYNLRETCLLQLSHRVNQGQSVSRN